MKVPQPGWAQALLRMEIPRAALQAQHQARTSVLSIGPAELPEEKGDRPDLSYGCFQLQSVQIAVRL